MVKMRCNVCNFQFETKEKTEKLFCPNCGEREKIIKEPSAEDLIKEL